MQTPIAKSEHFQVLSTIDAKARLATLVFLGELNEEAKLEEVSSYIHRLSSQVDQVVLDLAGIRGLNSAGVRQWLSFVGELTSEPRIFFSKVSESLVDQANLVPQILGPRVSAILSVFAPYICTGCKLRSSVEIKIDGKAASEEGGMHSLREKPCPKCGSAAQLDGLIEEYFGFLSRLE